MTETSILPVELPGPDALMRAAVIDRAAQVLRPRGALGRLDEVAGWLAGWQRTTEPAVREPLALVFVADHGVSARGVSAYDSSATAAMLDALRSGAATAAVLASHVGARLEVVDVGVGRPTGDIVSEDALSPDAFARAFGAGRAAVQAASSDLLVVGEMGIGNTTAAAAICTALFGMGAEAWTGRGTGVDEARLAHKTELVAAAANRVGTVAPLEVLRRLGGSELAALAGAIVEARVRSIPVLLDGFVVAAAVAPLELARHGALDHCLAAHRSSEPGHHLLLEKLGRRPLLELDLRLGEASGALLSVPLVRMAAAAVTDVATLGEWGIAHPR